MQEIGEIINHKDIINILGTQDRISPRRNCRILIINDEIEIVLDSYETKRLNAASLNDIQKVESKISQAATVEEAYLDNVTSKQEYIKEDELTISDTDEKIMLNKMNNGNLRPDLTENRRELGSKISEHLCGKQLDGVLNNANQRIKQAVLRPEHFRISDWPFRKYRKIAPNNVPLNTSEIWRLNPPKRNKKKYAPEIKNETQKISVRKKYIAKTSKRVTLVKKKTKKSNEIIGVSCGSDDLENIECRGIKFQKESSNNEISNLKKDGSNPDICLAMEEIEEEEFISPPRNENEVVESVSILSSENNPQLVVCPYCTYKNCKEHKIKKHMILFHMKCGACSECNYCASSMNVLITHMAKCHKMVRCCSCQLAMESQSIKSHLIKCYSKSVIDQCRFCNFKVVKKTLRGKILNLKEHVLNFHSKSSKDEYKCPLCDFMTNLDLEMKSHLYLSHEDYKGNIFNCIECTFIASSLTNLLNHMVVHSTEKQYFCVNCTFSSSSITWMNLHKNLHKSESYRCPYCKINVREHYLLKYHLSKCHKIRKRCGLPLFPFSRQNLHKQNSNCLHQLKRQCFSL